MEVKAFTDWGSLKLEGKTCVCYRSTVGLMGVTVSVGVGQEVSPQLEVKEGMV